MSDPTYDYFQIYLINAFDIQELVISDDKQAKEVAERLKFFFAKQGIDIKVSLVGVIEGESLYNSEQEYIASKDDKHEEIML